MEKENKKLSEFLINLFKKEEVDLRKLILPVDVRTVCAIPNQELTMYQGSTNRDKVFIDGINDYQKGEIFSLGKKLIKSPTDYAIANGVVRNVNGGFGKNKISSAAYWLRTAWDRSVAYSVENDGRVDYLHSVDETHLGVVPSMHLNLQGVIEYRKKIPSFGKIDVVKDDTGKVVYHTIEFGFYPQTKVENVSMLEALFKCNKMRATGKSYTGYWQQNLNLGHHKNYSVEPYIKNYEYQYGDQYFVRAEVNRSTLGNQYNDGLNVSYRDVIWLEVKPLKWIIKNWDKLNGINPNATGTSEYIDVCAEKIISGGIPFYPNPHDKFCSLWQNSSIRAWLNDINVYRIRENGNPKYAAPNLFGNFKGNGFLREAFVFSSDLIMERRYRERLRGPVSSAQKAEVEELLPVRKYGEIEREF